MMGHTDCCSVSNLVVTMEQCNLLITWISLMFQVVPRNAFLFKGEDLVGGESSL